jgi:BMFP domain-containing protein YqiC
MAADTGPRAATGQALRVHMPRHQRLKRAIKTHSYSIKECHAMTTTQTRFFDDLAKLMTGAAGAAQGVRREIDTLIQSQMERVLNNMDLVKREEFDAVKAMAQKAREENDVLAERIAALEAKLAGSGSNPVG